MTLTRILTFAGLTGTALMGGLFFAFGTTVMSSLERMPAGEGATAMNLINVRIQNPLFLLIFLGTALVCVALAVVATVQDAPGKWWLLAASLLYLVGVIVLSFAINIPLNEPARRARPELRGRCRRVAELPGQVDPGEQPPRRRLRPGSDRLRPRPGQWIHLLRRCEEAAPGSDVPGSRLPRHPAEVTVKGSVRHSSGGAPDDGYRVVLAN
jgi:uncharacterized membrane protein